MRVRTAVAALLLGLACVSPTISPASAQQVDPDPCRLPEAHCPDLQVLPAGNPRIETVGRRSRLRFDTTTYNVGSGPLELEGGEVVAGKSKQRVYQRIYNRPTAAEANNVPIARVPVGDFVYHPQHRHFHLQNFAFHELIPVDSNGNLLESSANKRTSSKTSFCVMDYVQVTWDSTITPVARYYNSNCQGSLQGMSRGWADTYGAHLAGQEIDVTSLPAGDYVLRITVNPAAQNSHLHETARDAKNVSTLKLRLAGGGVTVLPQ